MNPIQYLVSMGFKITSDPNLYASGVWGLRNYTVNGYNYDYYSYGYHRAYDFGSLKGDGAAIPSVCDGVVVAGTTAWGNFGAQVVILDDDGKYQHIYGHLKRNIPVKVGQRVKRGQTIGYQGNTNYDNVYMASHLHYQVQTAGYRTERAFVTDGINPLNIRYGGTTSKAPAPAKMQVLTYDIAWDWKFKVKLTAALNYRIYPHTSATRESTIPKGTTLTIDRLYASDGHWWGRTTYKSGIWFVALGKRNANRTFITDLDAKRLWVNGVGKVNTSGGRVTGKKNTYELSGALVTNTPKTNANSNTGTKRTFNRNINRGRSTSAYVMGTIDNLGAQVRKRNGSQSKGFDWNSKAGYDLKPGAKVYIFEVHNGWGRIYTGNLTGYGSNDWIWLDRLQVQYIYK